MRNKLPNNWIDVNLYGVCIPVSTGVPKFEGEKRYYSTGSIKTDSSVPEGYYTYVDKPSRANRIVKKNDILQARMAGTDKAILITSELENNLFSTGFIQLRTYYKTILPNFLYYYFKSELFNLQKDELASGSTQVAINDNNAKKIKFPLPPFKEQIRIVDKLDTLFLHLININKRLEKIPVLLKNFRQQVLTQAVNGKLTEEWRKGKNLEEWKFTSLAKYCSGSFYGPRFSKDAYKADGYRTVRTTDMSEDGRIILNDSIPRVHLDDPKKVDLYKVQKGDLLITRTGSIGKMARYYQDEVIIPSAYLIRFRFNENAEPDFIYYSLTSPFGQAQMGLNSTAITQPNLNAEKIKKLQIPDISIEEQREVIRVVEKLLLMAYNIERQYNNLKESIEKFPRTILNKAFKGELVPQLKSDGDARNLLREIENLKIKA